MYNLLAKKAAKENVITVRRRGLIRSAARTAGRTAVIAGTATAVSKRVANRHDQKSAQQNGAPQGIVATAPAAGGDNDIVGRLQQLADLRAAGALTDTEFATAKARLLQT